MKLFEYVSPAPSRVVQGCPVDTCSHVIRKVLSHLSAQVDQSFTTLRYFLTGGLTTKLLHPCPPYKWSKHNVPDIVNRLEAVKASNRISRGTRDSASIEHVAVTLAGRVCSRHLIISVPMLLHDHAATSTPFDGTSNRRSACDRCRSHKLRCERDPGALQCRRCVKANAECVTSATLKSGRPPHLYSSQRRQRCLDEEDHQQGHVRLGHRQLWPDFPTPPPTNFDIPLERTPTHCDDGLDMQLLASPGNFNAFGEMWTDSLAQEATGAISAQPMASTNANHDGHEPSFTPLSDMHSECLKELGCLQANVLVDLEAVKACTTADKCAQTATTSAPGQGPDFLVGRMLDHSAALVEILDCFEPASVDPEPLSNERGSKTAHAPPEGLRCDAPTMFSLLSCYVCVIRIYRTIFSCIHDSMPFLLGLKQPVPQLFPGMKLGGFTLEGRLDLQVRILIQVSEDMLAKLEARCGIAEDAAIASRSIFEHENAARILRMMLEKEADEQPQLDEKRGGCESLKNILASLKRMIQMEDVNHNS